MITPFPAFLAANVLERFAASAMTALLGFQVFALRHHALDLGWLGLAEALPGVTLVLHGGHVADRHVRQRIVLATTIAIALLAATAAAAAHLPAATLLPALIAVAFLAGVIRAYANPAASGLEAQVVPARGAIRGIAGLATTSRLADVAGPIAVGFGLSATGAGTAYAAIAAIFALAAAALLAIPGMPPPPPDGLPAHRTILAGLAYVFADQVLVGSMALDLFAVFFGGAVALLPAVATDILHVGPVGFGFLRAALGVGALAAAIGAPTLLPQRHAGWTLHGVVAGFGLAMIAFGLSRSLALSLAALFVAGVCDGASVIIRRAILRLAAPEAMRGRIGAVKSVFVGSSNELGTFESGIAAHLLGVGPAIWSGGMVTLAIVATTALTLRRLRRLDLVALAAADTLPEVPMPSVGDAPR